MDCWYKRLFIGFLVLLVVFANGAFANASADEPSNWAKQDVRWMIARNIVPEHLQRDYQKYITREEFASLVYYALNDFVQQRKGADYLLNIPREGRFEDIDSPIINTAYSIGLINGVSATEFKPDERITREQGAVMMANLLHIISLPNLSNESFGFVDHLSISKWALDSVNICGNAKIFAGTDQGFRPSDPYTREQAIVTVKRMIDATGGKIHSLKIRNTFELPLDSIVGGLLVGPSGFKLIKPHNEGDNAFQQIIAGLGSELSPETIETLKSGSWTGTIRDGKYTVTGMSDQYLFEISW
jgi:hypothetical protein